MGVEMSKTVSFVARDELAEWLESRADAEMKTVSSVVQDVVAEKYRDEEAGSGSVEEAGSAGFDDPLEKYPEVWYELEEKHQNNYAVEHPSKDNSTKYYKTRDGAAKRVRTWYGKD